ncbi:hypothetical protein JTB14_020515 [Gonioctena quinquepunctata]|nr:hypothetical protein JTB14_020515 [Gonioctena quinquepunctata]
MIDITIFIILPIISKKKYFQGEPVKDVNYPVHRSYQVTALCWHPEKTLLVSGWENGELKVWSSPEKEFINVVGSHRAPITLLEFSEKGGRLVSCDSFGSVIGWKIDNKGEILQPSTLI